MIKSKEKMIEAIAMNTCKDIVIISFKYTGFHSNIQDLAKRPKCYSNILDLLTDLVFYCLVATVNLYFDRASSKLIAMEGFCLIMLIFSQGSFSMLKRHGDIDGSQEMF